jgi:farnesyl diphosphate synthase
MTTETDSDDFARRLKIAGGAIEAMLEDLLADPPLGGEIMRPPRLLAAMRHGALAGGKRLRPFLTMETAKALDLDGDGPLRAGAAIELIHCYSLVHDDLPAMDDDDLRRGRPTVHKAFDEATAILAGDALLTLAFDAMGEIATHPDGAIRAALCVGLSRAAGLGGMAGGQMLDLAAEGRFEDKGALAERDISTMQAMKTGALLRFACRAGALLGQADGKSLAAIDRYGAAIGEAFQIADDLLDVEGDAASLGKAAGKDAAAGKATLVAALGVKAARARLDALVADAEAALAPFAAKADILRAAARFIAERRN